MRRIAFAPPRRRETAPLILAAHHVGGGASMETRIEEEPRSDECLRRGKSRSRRVMSADGKWAIITGASSGIGRALALEFAAGGFSVLLTGRNTEALNDVAAQCATKHGVKTEVVSA